VGDPIGSGPGLFLVPDPIDYKNRHICKYTELYFFSSKISSISDFGAISSFLCEKLAKNFPSINPYNLKKSDSNLVTSYF
jgi:hypothetical protein